MNSVRPDDPLQDLPIRQIHRSLPENNQFLPASVGRFLPGLSNIGDESQILPAYKSQVRKRLGLPTTMNDDDVDRAVAVPSGTMMKSGVNVYIRALNSFFSWCHESDQGYLTSVIRHRELKTDQAPAPTMTEPEIKIWCQFKPRTFTEQRVHAIGSLMLDTGVRIDEALSIREHELDLAESKMLVHGKGGKDRFVGLSKVGRKLLNRYVLKTAACRSGIDSIDTYIFGTGVGSMLSQRNSARDLGKLNKALGIADIHWHLFRHTFGTRYIANGGDVAILKQIMGHSDIRSTMIYVANQTDGIIRVQDAYSPLSRAALIVTITAITCRFGFRIGTRSTGFHFGLHSVSRLCGCAGLQRIALRSGFRSFQIVQGSGPHASVCWCRIFSFLIL